MNYDIIVGNFAGYKGYLSTIAYDFHNKLYYGRLTNVRDGDIVAYHSENIIDLYDKYKDAVDDYEEILMKLKKGI